MLSLRVVAAQLQKKKVMSDHPLTTLLKERISSGLKRKTIKSVSQWAEAYRVMGQPFPGHWRFDHHPWARGIHDCEAELVIGQKGAQLAFTETALNKAFYSIDVKGVSVLYVLPASKPDAGDFSTSRFDPALELSSHLGDLFTDVRNVGHKRAGNANLFIRGSKSRSQMKSIPAGLLIFDEVDEMFQDNIPLAMERSSGQLEKQSFLLSTPTIDNYGINAYYKNSTQNHFFFKCPRCSRQTELIFPDCLIITAEEHNDPRIMDTHLICKECKGVLEHDSKIEWLKDGYWVEGYTDRLDKGFHVSQLYSMTVKPPELAKSYLKAKTNPADEQEFWNSKLGLTHIVAGARITDADIDKCIGSHKKVSLASTGVLVTMGVDVGKWLHYEIDQWLVQKGQTNDINLLSLSKVLMQGKVLNFEELDLLMHQYNVNFCVIDANPEKRKAIEFAQRFWGSVRLCYYGRGISGKNIHIHSEEEHTLTVDRTSWLDLSFSRIKGKRITFPIDIDIEYRNHLKALVRIYEKDVDGNPVGKYVKGNEDDHYAHARCYAEIALPLGASLAGSHDIGNIL